MVSGQRSKVYFGKKDKNTREREEREKQYMNDITLSRFHCQSNYYIPKK